MELPNHNRGFSSIISIVIVVIVVAAGLLFLTKSSLLNKVNTNQSRNNQLSTQNLNNYLQSSDWKEFNSASGNFKMSFPTLPKEQNQTVTVKGTNLNITTFLSQPSENEVFMVGLTTYPNQYDVSDSKAILDNVVNGAVQNIKGQLVSSKPSTFNSYPAVDYVIRGSNLYAINKSFLVGHTLYIIENFESTNSFPSFDRFVNSFQLIGK